MITQRVKGRRFDKRLPFMHRATSAEYKPLNAFPLQIGSVAFFTEVYSPIINGVVASIDGLRAGLRDAHVDATIVAPYLPNARDDDATIVRLPSLPLPTSTGYRLSLPFVPREARARIRRAQIVHVHSPFITGHLGANIARRNGVPLVFTYHTRIDEYAHYAPFDPRIARDVMIRLTRAFANRADVVIVPTDAMRDRLLEIGVRRWIAVVASSIDVARFANGVRTDVARAFLGARDDARIALAVSRVAKEKHLELAIDALACTREIHLAIVGDGPHRAALEARANERGVRERVTFTGALPPAALPDLYASSDAFVFPSETETQGLVLAEALAAGLPVVAVDAPVNREVLGGSGRLVPADPQSMAAALELAVAGPRPRTPGPDLAERFGRASRTAAVLEIYQKLLTERF
jgi:glycosyltransferase involved in cell wall biosynthesis